jgi:hypothetical protein
VANAKFVPFPVTIGALEDFGAYLKREGYKSPATYIWGVIRQQKTLDTKWKLDDPGGRLKDIITSVERDLAPVEQMLPLTFSHIGALFGACANDIDIDAALVCAGTFVTLSRADGFVSTPEEDITISVADGRVQFKLSKVKGAVRQVYHTVELERVLGAKGWKSCIGEIPACPVSILQLVKVRKACARFGNYQKYERALAHLIQRAGIMPAAGADAGRTRRWFNTHSGRIGGACALLKAGLALEVVRTVGNWEANSGTVEHYARFVMLRPSLVDGWAFYNPRALKHKYGSGV